MQNIHTMVDGGGGEVPCPYTPVRMRICAQQVYSNR